ncbi:MAG: FG-GAP repeat protein, partial [Planctomycetota bacterium]
MKNQAHWLLSILLGLGALASQGLAQCEVQKLTASNAGCYDKYGQAVAIDGTTALVGAYLHDGGEANTGSVYVYELTPAGWVQTAELVSGDPNLGDTFGEAVAISGDTALVTAPGDDEAGGAAGAAYIFKRTAGVWVQTQKLFASDAGSGAWWGESASMSGDRAIIGNR